MVYFCQIPVGEWDAAKKDGKPSDRLQKGRAAYEL